MPGRRKKWSEMSPGERAAVLALVAAQAVLTAYVQRDLGSRTTADLRGTKMMWRVLSLNTVGAVAYVAIGRR